MPISKSIQEILLVEDEEIESNSTCKATNDISLRKQPPITKLSIDKRIHSMNYGSLYSGSEFKGTQKSGSQVYNVSVSIQV